MIYRFKILFESIEKFVKEIYESFISIIKVLLLSKFKTNLPVAHDEECIVLGNGPSLRNVLDNHKDFLLGKSLYCVNMFPSAKEYTELKPKNLVWLDSAFYAAKSIEALNEIRPDVVKVINDLTEKTNWPLNLYLPVLGKKSKYLREVSIKNPNIKICYFNYTIVKGFSWFRHSLFKANLGMPLCQNVLGACIFIALNARYKKIYLLGADHSWTQNLIVSEENEILFRHSHFYSDKDKERIGKTYKDPIAGGKVNISDFFMACVKMFNAYYILEEYSVELKSKVFNATEGSYIDAFERYKIK